MVGHGGSSIGSYLADPTSPIPSHCASIVATSTLRVNGLKVWLCDIQRKNRGYRVDIHMVGVFRTGFKSCRSLISGQDLLCTVLTCIMSLKFNTKYMCLYI